MKARGIAAWGAAAAAIWAGPAVAGEDGNSLYANCTSGQFADIVACNRYIVGVVDGILVVSPREKPPFVIPQGVTGQQLNDVVIAYLKDNPDKRHWEAQYLVWNAIHAAFPAPARSAGK